MLLLLLYVLLMLPACVPGKRVEWGARHRRQTEKATVKMQQEPALTEKQQQQEQQDEERDKVMERQHKAKRR